MLGVAIVVGACDIAEFVSDPMPRFEQTWNLPASSDTISIATLLPADNSVQVLPDSSGFSLTPPNIAISQAVGPQCAQCLALHGTTAPKPAFLLTASNGANLATDVVSASVLGGTMTVTLTNNMSFDPLRVTTGAGAQGKLKILIHSGSVVFGEDSVLGTTTTWAPGTQMVRTIALRSGTAPANLTADVTLDSPLGDAAFINANGTLNASVAVPTLNVASVSMNITGRTLRSDSTEIDLSDLESGITDKVVSGALRMTITNPLAISGNVDVRFTYAPGQSVTKTISLPSGAAQVRTVALTRADLDNLFGRKVMVTVSGAVSSTGPLTLTPRLKIIVANRMILTLRTGEGQ